MVLTTGTIVQISDALPKRLQTNGLEFNDLIDVGEWPKRQMIERITEIHIFLDSSRGYNYSPVLGLKVYYLLKGSAEPIQVLHGVETNYEHAVYPRNDTVVAINGLYNDTDNIVSLGFVFYNTQDGTMTREGPFGRSPLESTPFAALGPILAFHGTTYDGQLTSLGIVKLLENSPFLTFM